MEAEAGKTYKRRTSHGSRTTEAKLETNRGLFARFDVAALAENGKEVTTSDDSC